jgi:hypothetical protein
MSYTINRYNQQLITTVADGTIDATLDIKLIGKNYAGYGGVQNENFVYLLENFASGSPPPRPISGQIWFDSQANKLKFYDGSKFRTTGGAEISDSAHPPSGLTVGDFWFDTTNQQLYAWTGSTFTLIGPQGVAGSATTQMRSESVLDTNGAPHAIIRAIDNGQTVFTISSDADFTLNGSVNPITGFTKIRQGVTLCYTTEEGSQLGQTTSSHRFFGTATNSERLGGYDTSAFVRAGAAVFSTLVKFSDSGFTVGTSVDRLKVFNDGTIPTIINQAGDTITFQTTVSSVTKTPLKLVGTDILPGANLTSNIGSASFKFNNVYANNYYGSIEKADKLSVSGTYRDASTDSIANTIAARDNSGNLTANLFQGVASSANYADLAEKYLPDAAYEVGTVMSVGGEFEVTSCNFGERALGVISANPAYMMNQGLLGGVYVALKGRVPVKVVGQVRKGQQLIAANDGTAIVANPGSNDVFAIALESSDDDTVKLVECVVL